MALIEFESVVEAARCAAALRDAVEQKNRALANELRIAMRIGINLGDIIVEGGDIFGDGVNIAARVEALAEPGSIYVSGIVHDQVAGKVDFDFDDLGPKALKNISRPIYVFRMGGSATEKRADGSPGEAASPASSPDFDDRRAIAVLPFANFSGDPEQEFFADGITEDIISRLAGWRRSRSSPATRLYLQGSNRRHRKGRSRAWRPLCPRRQRAEIGPSRACHRPVDPGGYRPSHHGRAL